MRISDMHLTRSKADMDAWPEGKFLVDTVNAHSFVVAQKDEAFAKALLGADAQCCCREEGSEFCTIHIA